MNKKKRIRDLERMVGGLQDEVIALERRVSRRELHDPYEPERPSGERIAPDLHIPSAWSWGTTSTVDD